MGSESPILLASLTRFINAVWKCCKVPGSIILILGVVANYSPAITASPPIVGVTSMIWSPLELSSLSLSLLMFCICLQGFFEVLVQVPPPSSANCWRWKLDCHTSNNDIKINKEWTSINACKRQVLRGKPLNGKKPRRPLGQENCTRSWFINYTLISHTIALRSL